MGFKVYPELNHLFAVSKSSGVADYYDPMAQVDAAFQDDLVHFLVTVSAAAPAEVATGGRPPRDKRIQP